MGRSMHREYVNLCFMKPLYVFYAVLICVFFSAANSLASEQ